MVIGTTGLSPVPPGTTTPPPGTSAFTIARAAMVSTLNAGSDVTITTAQPGSTMAGDITVNGALSWTGAGDLSLEAERDIRIEAAVTTRGGTSPPTPTAPLSANAQRAGDRERRCRVALTAQTGDSDGDRRASGNVIVSPPRAAALSLDARRAGSTCAA